jgi:hypothetical protein
MLTTISLDNELPFNAGEIGDERPDWVLATEFATAKPSGAQEVPE